MAMANWTMAPPFEASLLFRMQPMRQHIFQSTLRTLKHPTLRKAQADDSFYAISTPEEQKIPIVGATEENPYLGEFIRMLGLDKPADDREDAADALWRHSEGGKENVKEILAFPGCLRLVNTLISSESSGAAEAAAGLFRQISVFAEFRSAVVQAGAIEEIIGLLTRKQASLEVREQAVHALWNLSFEPEFRDMIATPELLPVLIAMLESEEQGEQAPAAGIIANISKSESLQKLLLEAGALPKLANILKSDIQKASNSTRREARSALLELSSNPDAKASTIEQGLMFVPVIGAEAYKSLKDDREKTYRSVPEGVKLEHPLGSLDSPFGAGDFLLGLNYKKQEVDEATQREIEGQTRLSFLKRLGVLGTDGVIPTSKTNETKRKLTIMPWWDAIPRIVLVLGLEDAAYAKQGAQAVSEVAIVEEYRQKLAKAGAVPHLVYLLGSGDESATEAAADAIGKLSISQKVRSALNAFDVVPALVSVLTADGVPASLQEKVVGALICLTQTQEEVKAMVRSGNVAGIIDIVKSADFTDEARAEAESVLKEISSLKSDPRDKVVKTAGGVPALVKLLQTGSHTMKQKAAAVLENIAIKEAHAVCIAEAGVDSALKASFQEASISEEGSDAAWLAVCSTSKLLGKLLNFQDAREKLDCSSYLAILSGILKNDAAPLFVKDWVSACLLKLANSTGSPLDFPVNREVIIHDTIPALVEEMKTGKKQDDAVVQLRDLVSCGFPEYIAAVANVGGIIPVVETLERSQSVEARSAALSILYNLGMNEENHPVIIAAGAVPLLQKLVRSEADGWKLALDLLRVLPV